MIESQKLTTQQQIIWDYLKAGRTLTNKLAIIALGIGSLSSRIAELRKMGYEITDEYETDPFERRFLKYRSPCRMTKAGINTLLAGKTWRHVK